MAANLVNRNQLKKELEIGIYPFLDKALTLAAIPITILTVLGSQSSIISEGRHSPYLVFTLCLIYVLIGLLFSQLVQRASSRFATRIELTGMLINIFYVMGIIIALAPEPPMIPFLHVLTLFRAVLVFKNPRVMASIMGVLIVSPALAILLSQAPFVRCIPSLCFLSTLGILLTVTFRYQKKNLELFEVCYTFFEQSDDMFYLVSPKGRILSINPAVENTLGYSSDELVGQNFQVLYTRQSWRDNSQFFDEWARKKNGEGVCETELRVQTKGGKVLDVMVKSSMIRNSSGEIVSYVVTHMDLTEAKRNKRIAQEEKARSQHAAKLAALGEMAGGVAHEINNPLAIIQGYTSKLERMAESQDLDLNIVKNATEKINSTVYRVSGIVKGLKNLSRDGAKDPMEELEIGDIVKEVLGFCREKFKSSGVELRVNLGDTPSLFKARRVEISQVILNVLNNASDAVSKSQTKWIQIDTFQGPEFIDVRISDSGHGILPKYKNRIMQPFFTTKKVGEGTGLGLSISQRIITDHGGEIFVDDHGPHTTFVIRLPKAVPVSRTQSL